MGKTDIPIDPKRTAVLVMHCWELLPAEEFPETYEIVEYLSRANQIYEERLKPFLEEVRRSGMRVIHVALGFEPELQEFAGYHRIQKKYPPVQYETIKCSPEHEDVVCRDNQLFVFLADDLKKTLLQSAPRYLPDKA